MMNDPEFWGLHPEQMQMTPPKKWVWKFIFLFNWVIFKLLSGNLENPTVTTSILFQDLCQGDQAGDDHPFPRDESNSS